jgi:hypothetical protein
VAKVVARCQITTIAEMREGLQYQIAHLFRSEDDFFEDSPFASLSTSKPINKRHLSSDTTPDELP